jgi:nucleotide-binding universal stress UspA family protein
MFKNVLVGVDGSQNGRDALALAVDLSAPDATLTLAHVHGGGLHPLHVSAPSPQQEQEASRRLLEQERSAAGVSAELISVLADSPGAGLHRQAEEQHADLLVVGSCGRGALGRVMLGDDTRAALNGAPCGVAVAAGGYREHAGAIVNVGVGYNGSSESEAALELARELAGSPDVQVKALEVVSIPTYAFTGLMPPMLGEGIDAILAEATERMRKLDGAHGRAVYGLTGEELAAFGDELDILVVGSRSYGPLRRLVVGSTSDYLERHARCSLLVLPRGVAAGNGSSPVEERESTAVGAGVG